MKRFPMHRFLKSIRAIDRKFPLINSGGCGFFAMALHEALTKHGIQSTIIVLSSNVLISFSHVVIRLDEFKDKYGQGHFYVDSTGAVSIEKRCFDNGVKYEPIEIAPNKLKQSFEIDHAWNHVFWKAYSKIERAQLTSAIFHACEI